MQCLVEEQVRSYELYPNVNKGEWLQNKRNLLRRAKNFHSLKIRSRSLSERLHNEINLVCSLPTSVSCLYLTLVGIQSCLPTIRPRRQVRQCHDADGCDR